MKNILPFVVLVLFPFINLFGQGCDDFAIRIDDASDIDVIFSDKEKCDTIDGLLEIEDVVDLRGLNFLKKASVIRINLHGSNLKILQGLDSLEEAHTIEIFAVLSDLAKIDAFKSLKKLEILKISWADELRVISDIPVEELLNLEISSNPKLQTLDFLPNLKYVSNFDLILNDEMHSIFTDDQSFLEIGFQCNIGANSKLERINLSLVSELILTLHINDLPSLTEINIDRNEVISIPSFFLSNLPLIETFPDFPFLENSSYFFGVVDCPMLEILPEFPRIDSVAQFGFYKTGLKDISGIRNLNVITDSLIFVENSNLSQCNYNAICMLLENEPSRARINGNKNTCLTENEVFESCNVLRVDHTSKENIVSVSPIPATDNLNIFSANYVKPFTYEIFSLEGARLKEGIVSSPTHSLDISVLNSGIYLLKTGKDINKIVVF